MFTITKDYLFTADTDQTCVGETVELMPLYGIERAMGEDDALPGEGPVIKFRLWDDDNEKLYAGELTDDDDCLNQSAALRWGETMAGATRIDVKRDGAWITEIG